MRLKKLLITLLIIVSQVPLLVSAQVTGVNPPNDGSDPFGFNGQLEEVAGPYSTQADVPLEERIGDIIGIFLSFLGVIFLILMLVAGFNWMTAGGEEEKISKARDTIREAIIGLVIVVAAYAISIFVIESIWGTGL